MKDINKLLTELDKEVTPKGKILLIELLDSITLKLEAVNRYLKDEE
jgi:hypothetical protein